MTSHKQSPRSFDMLPPKPKSKKSAAEFPSVGMTLSSYNSGQNQNKSGRNPAHSPRSFNPPAAPSRFTRFRRMFTRKRVTLAILFLFLLTGGYIGFKVVYNAHRLFGGSVFDVLSTSKLKGESSGRVNILLAGNSADDAGHQGGTLTDSIMILSVDTKNHTGFMLSIPRDLYVHVPGAGHQKINAVYPAGEKENFNEDGYAKGGMGLLEKTIEDDFGIRTQYYALVDYSALRDAVNSVGGVDVTINSSDPRGLYDPSRDWTTKHGILVKLSNGTHHLNGQQALNLARARGDARGSYGFANSDFTRAQNQREIILALRSKATSAGVITNPIRLGALFDSVGGNVKTDMKLSDVRRLYDITKDIGGGKIESLGLNDAYGVNLIQNYRTSSGESALIPAAGLDDYDDIQAFVKRVTSPNLLTREGATVTVLNGTSVSGLAARQSDTLDGKGITVNNVASADSETYTTTQIIDLSKGAKPTTLAALKKAYPGATTTSIDPFKGKYTTDFIVILGADVANAEKAQQSASQ